MLPKHIHYIGIAGIGVSALAQIAQARGVQVSGSDPSADPDAVPAVARLLAGGATIAREHREDNIAPDLELVVYSAAVADTNPEMRAARERGLRTISRAEFLGELMAAHPGPTIAISGTHGKSTTTGMIGVMLQTAGLDPTVVVGAEVPQLGGNMRIGSANGPFVAEACEAYDSFLHLKPQIAVVTNIEADHLDHYGTFERVQEAFRCFLAGAETIVACADDKGVSNLLDTYEGNADVCTYGFNSGITTKPFSGFANNLSLKRTARFDIELGKNELLPVQLSVPGLHNVDNALAAFVVGLQLGLSPQAIADGLKEFRGVGRRQEILGQADDVLVVDDYAHHPTEIRATLAALQSAYPARRLVAVFQPHLYSRTRDFLNEFADALAQADAVVVTDIYAAREAPIPGVWAGDIANRIAALNPNLPVMFEADKRDIPDLLATFVQPNDCVVFMGAGDIRDQGEAFAQRLREQGQQR